MKEFPVFHEVPGSPGRAAPAPFGAVWPQRVDAAYLLSVAGKIPEYDAFDLLPTYRTGQDFQIFG